MASLNVIDKSNKKTSYIALKPLMHNVPKWSDTLSRVKTNIIPLTDHLVNSFHDGGLFLYPPKSLSLTRGFLIFQMV